MMKAARLHGAMKSGITEFTLGELNENVKVDEIPRPKPRSGQVLLKIERAVINPMDMSFLKASYGRDNHKPFPYGLGSEGIGRVVESNSLLGHTMVGKRVAFFKYNAAWAEYVCVPVTSVMVISEASHYESEHDGVSSFVNPLTCLAFVEIALAAKAKAVVATASGSALGQMLIRHGKRNGIKVISVVRSERSAKVCRDTGAAEVVISEDKDFHANLTKVCEEHKATICFDAVSGSLAGTVLNAMPNGSTMYVYGGLSEDRPTISTRDLIFKRKTMTGFWLKDYVEEHKWNIGLLMWSRTVSSYLSTDFKTEVVKSFSLTDINDAIEFYSRNMGAGKVVLTCDTEGL
jgi:NADPH:quinone reductase-like Zn-dependent oxidoreductase